MFFGYLVMALPTGRGLTSSLVIMMIGMFLIASGTGLFKGNLQVMVGDLYNNPKYSDRRDVAFSIFYMAIKHWRCLCSNNFRKIFAHGL